MSALAAYYEAMANEANAKATFTQQQTGGEAANEASRRELEGAQTNSVNVNAGLAPGLANSEIAQRAATTNLTDTQAQELPLTTSSEVNARGAQTQQTLAGLALPSSGLASALALALKNMGTSTGTPAATTPNATGVAYKPTGVVGFAKGGVAGRDTAKPAKSDTIAAKLAPGEAVLNRGAAEHLGTGVVDHLNKLGMLRMNAQAELKGHADALKSHSVEKLTKAAAKAKSRASSQKSGGKRSKAA